MTQPAAKKSPARKSATKKAQAGRSAPKRRVQPIPEGYHTLTPYLAIRGAANAIEFYKKAFGAKERMRMEGPGGSIGHAEIMIGDSVVMLADEFEGMDFLSPLARGGTPVTLHLYVRDCDATVAKAGAKVIRPLKDQFYGDRSGTVQDPFGHVWHISTHKEELSLKEIKRRGAEAMKEMG
jgi:PhnB protein